MDGRRSIETIVAGYLGLRLEGATGLRRRRIEAVLARLLDCCDPASRTTASPVVRR